MDNPIPPTASLAKTDMHPRALAHLGDSVYELWIREIAIQCCQHQVDALHRFSTERAQASFQVDLLHWLMPQLNETEQDVVRRARNMATPTSRRKAQALHRQATGFEALFGYWYLFAPERLQAIRELIEPYLISGELPSSDITQISPFEPITD